MCQSETSKPSLSTPASASTAAASKQPPGAVLKYRKKESNGDRGSWSRFLTNSFHGVLGASSMLVTLTAWIVNEYFGGNDKVNGRGLPLVLTLLSVLSTTVLSIHSSWYMLEQSPKHSTILDYRLKLSSVTKNQEQHNSSTNSFRIWVVAPHRGAFHRTSIIMQYANARILLLLQRRYWHDPSAPFPSASGILLWGLATLMCLRMLLGDKLIPPAFLARFKSTERKTISSIASANANATQNKAETTPKPIPTFWKNGNSYCFVLPMIVGVCADFVMSAWCEHRYFSLPHNTTSGGVGVGDGDSSSLFGYYSDHWLVLWHLQFLQVVAHVIAFAFTLAFRLKHTSKKKQQHPETLGNTFVRRFCNIRTLYWVCTTGVYILILIGAIKAKSTLQLLG